jgi:ribonuclease HI
MTYTVQFDGGTSCNIPRLGFGNGYGSYQINDEPIHRCNFNRPMSANAAEMFTLVYAVQALLDRHIDPELTDLIIIGDSQIVLNRVAKAFDNSPVNSKGGSPEFYEATSRLQDIITKFRSVKVEWQARLKSVAVFGH